MIAQIRPADMPAWIKDAGSSGRPVVLDVREPDEVRVACVKAEGFDLQLIPMGEIPARLDELDPSRPVACLCHHGARSQRVATFLQARGFAHVVNVAGGIHAWSLELDPALARY